MSPNLVWPTDITKARDELNNSIRGTDDQLEKAAGDLIEALISRRDKLTDHDHKLALGRAITYAGRIIANLCCGNRIAANADAAGAVRSLQ